MSAITQKGTSLTIGFNGNTYNGIFMEGATKEQTGVQKVIRNEDNATVTVLVEDLGIRTTLRGIVKASGWVEPRQGSMVIINSVNHRVESISTEYSAEEARISLVAIAEDSMAYS